MIRAAAALALVVAVAVGHALGAPFLADVEGQRLAVLGDVGAQAVGADAGVGECGGVAGVCERRGGVAGGLETDAVGEVSQRDQPEWRCGQAYSGHCVCWLTHHCALVAFVTEFGSIEYCCWAVAEERRRVAAAARVVKAFILNVAVVGFRCS